jgi:hypothetical protein
MGLLCMVICMVIAMLAGVLLRVDGVRLRLGFRVPSGRGSGAPI